MLDEAHLGLRRRFGEEVVDARLLGDGGGGARVVARDHHRADAHGAEALEPLGDAGLHDILEVDDAQHARAVGHRERRAARVADAVGDRAQLVRGRAATLAVHEGGDRNIDGNQDSQFAYRRRGAGDEFRHDGDKEQRGLRIEQTPEVVHHLERSQAAGYGRAAEKIAGKQGDDRVLHAHLVARPHEQVLDGRRRHAVDEPGEIAHAAAHARLEAL